MRITLFIIHSDKVESRTLHIKLMPSSQFSNLDHRRLLIKKTFLKSKLYERSRIGLDREAAARALTRLQLMSDIKHS